MKYSKILSHHEKRLTEQLKGRGGPFVDEVRRMARSVEALENLAANRSPMMTEDAHTAKIGQSAQRLKTQAEAANERVHRVLGTRLEELGGRIREKAGLFVRDQFAAEIRQALRSMPEKDRYAALNDAVKRGDGQTIQAVAEAPELLSGVPAEIATRSVEALEKQKAGDLIAERDALYESFDETLAALKAVNMAARDGFDPAKMREIREAEERHAEASEGFNSALNG